MAHSHDAQMLIRECDGHKDLQELSKREMRDVQGGRSGSGRTNDGGTLTGLGNLIIGYNEAG